MPKNQILQIRIEQELLDRAAEVCRAEADALGSRHARTQSAVIRDAIDRGLRQLLERAQALQKATG